MANRNFVLLRLDLSHRVVWGLSGADGIAHVSRACLAASTVTIASNLVLSTDTNQRDDDRDVKNGKLALTRHVTGLVCGTRDLPDCQRVCLTIIKGLK